MPGTVPGTTRPWAVSSLPSMEATEGLGHPVSRQTEEEGLSQAGGAMRLPLQPPV